MMRQSFAPMLSGYVGASYEVAGRYNEPMPSTGNEDPGNGLLGAIAILIALLHRRRTGHALSCENPQVNAAMAMMAHAVRTVTAAGAGEIVGAGLLDPLQYGTGPFERLYETSDGWVCVVARADHEIAALATVTGVGNEPGSPAGDAVADRLRDAFATRPTSAWVAELTAAGVAAVEPVGPNMHRFMTDDEQRRIGRVAEVVHPELGTVRELAVLLRVSDADVPPHRLAPSLGEHSDEILRWLDVKPDEIAELRARAAVR